METIREDLIIGRGPVMELLRSGREIECIYIQKELEGSVSKIVAIAREGRIPVKQVTRIKLDYLSAHGNHQGIVAQTSGARYSDMDDIYEKAGDAPLLVVLVDGVEDPHNLGAIIRTAEAAGAHGVVIPKRRNVGLTVTVVKASAGATEHIPIVRVPNLVSAMKELREKGVWFYAADMDGANWIETDFSGGVGLVMGSEGSGVSRLVRENCDFAVSIPMHGKISSLNVSVASGILLYEIARQRSDKWRLKAN